MSTSKYDNLGHEVQKLLSGIASGLPAPRKDAKKCPEDKTTHKEKASANIKKSFKDPLENELRSELREMLLPSLDKRLKRQLDLTDNPYYDGGLHRLRGSIESIRSSPGTIDKNQASLELSKKEHGNERSIPRLSIIAELKKKAETDPKWNPLPRSSLPNYLERKYNNSKRPQKVKSEAYRNKQKEMIKRSEQILSKISDDFRASLVPQTSKDARELIRTPPNDYLETLMDQHAKAVAKSQSVSQSTSANRNNFPLSQMKGSVGSLQSSTGIGRTVTSDPKKRASSDAQKNKNVSEKIDGILDFKTLLKKQNKKIENDVASSKTSSLNNSSAGQNSSAEPKNQLDNALKDPLDSVDNLLASSIGADIQGQLRKSVKTMDQAAKVAQSLGTLISRVARQISTKDIGRDSGHGSNFPGVSTTVSKSEEQLLNAHQPLSKEIQRGAQQLRTVADTAQEVLHLHENIKSSSGAATMSQKPAATQSTSEMEIQTESGDKKTVSSRESAAAAPTKGPPFEFVPQMSYTDQLMLKRLRSLQPTWEERKSSDSTTSSPRT